MRFNVKCLLIMMNRRTIFLMMWLLSLPMAGWSAKGELKPRLVVCTDIAPADVEPGDTLALDASASTDPDGDTLNFHWWQQPEIGSAMVSIEGDEKSVATIHIPADAAGGSIHLICEIHDEGPFHLVAYRRIILSIR